MGTASVWIVLQKIHSTEVTKGLYPNDEVRCPTCTQQHQLPAGGIPKLPVDFKSNQLIEIINQETKQQLDVAAKESLTIALEAKDDLTMCTICKEEGRHVTGVQYCITCRSVLCDHCLAIHDRDRCEHAKVTLDCSKIICKTHTTHFIYKYCLQCCTPICMVCTMREHGQHNAVEFIGTNTSANGDIQNLKAKLTHIEEYMLQRKCYLTSMLKISKTSYAETKGQIKHEIDSQIAKLKQDQDFMLSQLEDFHYTVTDKITSSDAKIGDLIESVGVIKCQLDDIEHPLGIDSVTLARHASIQHCEQACSRIQQQSNVKTATPLYKYEVGTVKPGVLILHNDTAKHDEKDMCVICMTDPVNPKVLPKCKHTFCTQCIDECFKKCGPKCPSCGEMYGGSYARRTAPGQSIRYERLDGYGDLSRYSGAHFAAATGGITASIDPASTNRSIQHDITSRGITPIGQSNASGALPLTGSTSTSGAGVDPNTVIHSWNYRRNRSAGGHSNTPATNSSTSSTGKNDEKDMCVICMTDPVNPKVLPKCKHIFCTSCIDECFKKCGPKCPSCGTMYGALTGNQPKNGRMTVSRSWQGLPGYEEHGSITISYIIPNGKQGVSTYHCYGE